MIPPPMDIPSVAQMVVDHPVLAGLDPHYRHLFTDCVTSVRCGVQEEVFHEGADADHFYLIQAGRISLETFVPGRGSVPVQFLGAGEALGSSWMYPPHRWQFTARAVEPCQLLAFGAARLRAQAEENHDFGYELMRRVSRVMLEQLQSTRRKLVEFYVAPG